MLVFMVFFHYVGFGIEQQQQLKMSVKENGNETVFNIMHSDTTFLCK